MYRSFVIIIAGILILLLPVCTSYWIRTPDTGVTNQFVTPYEASYLGKKLYDFRKLENDYGLVIYGFSIIGYKGSGEIPTLDTVTGLRVWEHKFVSTDPTETIVDKSFRVFDEKNVGLGIKNPVKVDADIDLTYRKNRIVYAGHFTIDINNYEPISKIDNRFDDDCRQWIGTYYEFIKNTKIDTVLMNLNLRTEKPGEQPDDSTRKRRGYR